MRWATQKLIHFDRVISAWLILRFVDPAAQFNFLAADEVPAADVILFGIRGAHLGSHDTTASTFQRILATYSISDPSLEVLAKIVADVVDHVMHDRDRTGFASRGIFAGGMLALAEGTLLLSTTDEECLERSLPLYDAIYARLQAQIALDQVAPSPPASVLDQTLQLSRAAEVLRGARAPFSGDAFAAALGSDHRHD
jgi:hypothetical protein